MGLSLTLNYLKSSETHSNPLIFFSEIQKQLGLEGQIVTKNATFDDVINTLHLNEEYLSLLFINGNLLIKSDSDFINKEQALKISKNLSLSILKIEYSDTVMVESFAYFEKGKMLREFTNGLDVVAEELKIYQHLMPKPLPDSIIKGDVNIGNPLWFEKNGTDPDSLMETYGISMEDIDVEYWSIWKKK